MKRRHDRYAARLRILPAALAAAIALSACGGDQSAKDAEKLDGMDLSSDQRAVAEALIDGFKSETGTNAVTDAELERAACYAKNVDMPDAFADVHKLYLADYAAIDEDFYPWFEENGVSMDDAWDIAERVKEGFEACSVG